MKVHLRKGLRIDDLGDEALVLDQSGGQVHRVDGDAVAVLRLLAGSGPRDGVEVPDALRAAVDELVDAGLVTTPTEFTRRKAIATGGAVWAAATVTTFALADPAAASTSCGMGISPTSSPQTYSTVGSAGMFTTGPAGAGMTSYSLLVRAWGGGGGGGGGDAASTGGGGGGGEYRGGNITVTECTQYTVTVGGGGAGGGNPGTNGSPSSFAGLLVANGGMAGTQPFGGGVGGAGGTGGTGGTGHNGGTGGTGGVPGTYQGGGGGGGGGGTTVAGTTGGNGGGDGSSGGTVRGTAGPGGTANGGNGGQGGKGVLFSSDGPADGSAIGGGGGGGGQAGWGHTGGMGADGQVWVGV